MRRVRNSATPSKVGIRIVIYDTLIEQCVRIQRINEGNGHGLICLKEMERARDGCLSPLAVAVSRLEFAQPHS